MYLQLQGVHQAGSQRVGEVLNDANNFLPVRTGGGTKLINLAQIVAVSVSADDEFDQILALCEAHQLRVTTSIGEVFDTRIHVNLPSGRNRPKDFMDQKKRFLLFMVED